MIIEGNPAEVRGVNSIQMSRRGFSEADIDAMKAAYRRLFGSRSERKDRSFIDAIAAIRAEFPGVAAIRKLCDDLEASAAGVHGRRLESARPDNKRSAVEHTAGAASIGGPRPG
jgi:UDP-N-acetylglucosamine acyltransferase